MPDFKFELDREGVRELLLSDEMSDVLKSYAEPVAAAANSEVSDGFQITTKKGQKRAQARVTATTYHAAAHNSKHHTLLKALGGGSG